LKQKGLTVTLLEAAATHGGRLKALTTLANFSIELGAEEIHGSKSEWYKIVQASGAKLTSKSTTDYLWVQNASITSC
jgi:monoamine oxidase